MSEPKEGAAELERALSAEEALRREKELTENIIGSSVDGILAFDRACRYTVWNPAMELISGVAATETIGKRAFDVFPFLEEIGEDWYFYEALAGRYAVARDRPFTIPSTGRAGFFEGHYTPLRNAGGKVVGGLAIIRDITEMKDTQAQLLQAGKLAAVGELGAGIAHELNQPLSGIQMLLDMIGRHPGRKVADFADDIELLREQVTRMARIVDNVRSFARRSDFQPRPSAAQLSLENALMLMSEQLRLANIDVVRSFEEQLPAIKADVMQLQQVFLNLISNALHALEEHEGARRLELGARLDGDRVSFWVEDSGPGVPDDVRERVFDPFFTTKDPGRGTGLGLSLCYGIVKKHAGDISVETAEGGGARFVFDIPLAAKQAAVSSTEETLQRTAQSANILVVDDEEILRKIVGRTLDHLGYCCKTVEDAGAALTEIERSQYHLALVDLKMPNVDGRSLCAQLCKLRPDLPVVAMSGFVTDGDRDALIALGVRTVLAKPFTANVLADVVASALSQGAAPSMAKQ